MLLAIDIGNTNTVIGVYAGSKLTHDWRLETKKERTTDEWAVYLKQLFQFKGLNLEQISGVVISNVVRPMERPILEMCRKYLHHEPLLVGPSIRIDMTIHTDRPEEVGADRIVNAIAAHHIYKQPLIVVDFGTATTFDYVSANGDYEGGVILPGIGISADALFRQADQLQRIEMTKPLRVIGKNTIECLQSGIYYGYIGMIDAMIERMEAEIGHRTKVIATGGFANKICADSKRIDQVCDHLTLEGLYLIYTWNQPA